MAFGTNNAPKGTQEHENYRIRQEMNRKAEEDYNRARNSANRWNFSGSPKKSNTSSNSDKESGSSVGGVIAFIIILWVLAQLFS